MDLSSVHRFIPVYGVVFLLSLFGLGSTIRITVSPNQFTPLIHNELNMTCVTEGPSYWAKQVIVIEIGKANDKPMAVINQKEDLTMGPSSLPNMEAEGHIDTNASKSYLTLTINKPKADQAGIYSCKSFYLDEEYQMQMQEEFFNVTVDDQDSTSMISFVIGKLSDLEKKVQHQNDKLEEYNQTIQNQDIIIQDQNDRIKGLQNQFDHFKERGEQQRGLKENQDNTIRDCVDGLSVLNDTVMRQVSLVENQNTSLAVYQDKMDAAFKGLQASFQNQSHQKNPKICAFSMWYGSTDKAIYQQPLVFKRTITNIGNAYNVSTGKFTAPYTGVYVFHLTLATIRTGKPTYINVLLSKNGLTDVAVVDVEDKQDQDQSSNTVVLSLQAGDLVWPWVAGIYGMDTVHISYTQFSGYLIASS